MIRAPVCSCGGRLRTVALEAVELEPLFGLRGVLEGPVPGLGCDKCGERTFAGRMLERMLAAVARAVIGQPHILTGEEASFLRKAVLGLTQSALAKRMGINPVTVADWERGERALSKEHDYELRGIAVSELLARLADDAHRAFDALAHDLTGVLTAPRLVAPPRRAKRYVIPASMLAA